MPVDRLRAAPRGADPVFAGWRDAIANLFASWEFVPRVIFFGVLLVIVLGAYGYAALVPASSHRVEEKAPVRWLGATERLMLLGGVAALFWLFLGVQLGYLFGNLPGTAASGVTFAEYARRGFGELTVVASASALLIVVSERYGNDDGRERPLRLLTFAVMAAVLLLLGSAFRRIWLYDAAYGFTTAPMGCGSRSRTEDSSRDADGLRRVVAVRRKGAGSRGPPRHDRGWHRG